MTAAVVIQSEAERLPFVVREGGPADLPFVHDSWLVNERGARLQRDASGRPRGFCRERQKQRQRLLVSLPSTRLRVCCLPDDRTTILGWLLYSETQPVVVYYLFTLFRARRLGIARMLLGDLLDEPRVLHIAWPAPERVKRALIPSGAIDHIPASWVYVPPEAILEH